MTKSKKIKNTKYKNTKLTYLDTNITIENKTGIYHRIISSKNGKTNANIWRKIKNRKILLMKINGFKEINNNNNNIFILLFTNPASTHQTSNLPHNFHCFCFFFFFWYTSHIYMYRSFLPASHFLFSPFLSLI